MALADFFRIPEHKMSSVVRSIDQTDRRVQYLYALANLTAHIGTAGQGNIVRIPTTSTVSSVMTLSQFNTAIDSTYSSAPTANQILRDMGKQIVINDGLLDTAVYRRVQLVNGATFEGVSDAAYEDLYVLTWIANPSSSQVVRVARTG